MFQDGSGAGISSRIVRHLHLSRRRGTGPGFKRRTPACAGPTYLPGTVLPRQPTDADICGTETVPHLLPAAASLLAISSPLHSLFKVLFIFPSRYLFAIGLLLIFSFRWNLPPALGCTRKQPDSWKAYRACWAGARTGLSPSTAPHSMGVLPGFCTGSASLDYNSASLRQADFQVELFPVHSPLLGES